jgi:hypothetical protein
VLSLLLSETVFRYVLVAECTKSKPTASRDSQCHIYILNFVKICEAAQNWDGGNTETVVKYFRFLWHLDPIPDHRGPLRSFAITLIGHITIRRTPLDEWSTRRRDWELKTGNTNSHASSGIRTHNHSEWPQTEAFYLRSHWDRYVVILAYILLLQVNWTTISEPNSRRRRPVVSWSNWLRQMRKISIFNLGLK